MTDKSQPQGIASTAAATDPGEGGALPLKTYTVLYAEDIPHYGSVDIEAKDDADALRIARAFNTDHVSYYEGCWDGAVCNRIVSIHEPGGKIIAHDIPLDDYRLHHGIHAQEHKASVTVDNRFRVDIRHSVPSPMATAQLVITVYPISDGEIWDEPYEVFAVDEDRIAELETQMKE